MKLTLYHGSRGGLVGEIRPDRSRSSCDFGQGFYMGVDVHQPRTLICGKDVPKPTLYTVEFDLSGLRVLRLPTDIDWALFVAFNRNLMESYAATRFYARYAAMRRENDVLFGKIANDRIYDTVRGFFAGELSSGCLLESLQAVNLGDQYCAITPVACAAVRVADQHVLCDAEIAKYSEQAARQRERALVRTAQIFRDWRHRDGIYFDEILARMAETGADRPSSIETLLEGVR